MKEIIRIEHIECGNGIFNSINDRLFESKFANNIIHRFEEHFLNPNRDLIKFNQNYYCAFKSINDLIKWLSIDELKSLVNIGFRIYKIIVKRYKEGNMQIVYTLKSIKQKIDITNYILYT